MVTLNARRIRSYIPLKGRLEWTITGFFASIIIFALVNASLDYSARNADKNIAYQHQLDRAIFAEVKQTPLITELKGNVTKDDTAKIDFSATNVNATTKVKNFECRIDFTEWVKCSSPVSIDLKEYNAGNSTHTLEIRVIDNHNGIESNPLVYLFK